MLEPRPEIRMPTRFFMSLRCWTRDRPSGSGRPAGSREPRGKSVQGDCVTARNLLEAALERGQRLRRSLVVERLVDHRMRQRKQGVDLLLGKALGHSGELLRFAHSAETTMAGRSWVASRAEP